MSVMKRKILISINPEHVQNIIAGIKKYEYRKIAAKQDISSIIIYETTPIKRIVAEAEIVDVLELPPQELWEQTKNESGISKAFFDRYFNNRTLGHLLETLCCRYHCWLPGFTLESNRTENSIQSRTESKRTQIKKAGSTSRSGTGGAMMPNF